MAKTDVKVCRFKGCTHPGGTIDITTDKYVVDGKKYYHKDCYKRKCDDADKEEKALADMHLIKNLWQVYVNPDVPISYLYKILRDFIDSGIDSDYMAFTMQYIVNNGLNLRYPQGFKFFLARKDIKAAYKESKKKKVSKLEFKAEEKTDFKAEEPIQQCALPKRVKGFADILGGR